MKRTPVDSWIAGRMAIAINELTQEKLTGWQLASFRRTMVYAKSKSRFYRRLLEDADPENIRTAEDLLTIPCTGEQDLAGNEIEFLCVNQKEVSRVVTVPTTGTLGLQKRISFSGSDQLSSMIFMEAGFSTMVTPSDIMLVMMSGSTEGSIGRTVEKALAPAGIRTFIYGTITGIADAYEYMRQCKPGIIVGVPNQIAALSRYGQMSGNPEAEHIKSVLLSADDIPNSLRQSISRLWKCNVFNHYGMTESGIAAAVECEGFSGYHTRDCDLMFEIINRDESGIGEIVFTTLEREAMPLIRYKTGDLGRFTAAACPCGSPIKRIEKVFGRKRNCFRLINGNTVHLSEIGNAVFCEDHAVDYDCAVSGNGSIEITVYTFSGQIADTDIILNALKENCTIGRAIDEGMKIKFLSRERNEFPADGNKKKTVIIKT